jgi:hypothetical protein
LGYTNITKPTKSDHTTTRSIASNQQPTNQSMKPYSIDHSNRPRRTTHAAAQKTLLSYNWLFAIALCASPIVSFPANAQSQWTTTDDFQLVPSLSALGAGLATNATGDIIAVGSGVADASGTDVAITRHSSDQGLNWSTLVTNSYPGASSCTFRAVANSGQTLYAAGCYYPGPNWFIAQSTDNGKSWQVIDSLARTVCSALAVDGAGNVFAAGGSVAPDGSIYLMVRKLAAGESSWSTVYEAQAPSGEAYGIAIHPTSGIFVIGSLPNGTQSAWGVLKSQDGGNTWAVSDLYIPAGRNPSSYGCGVAVDSTGNLYATGRAVNSWVTRRSTDGGTNWNTIDTFQYSTKGFSQGASVSFDYQGNVYVAGRGGAGKLGNYWLVRKLPAGSTSWQNSDVFQRSSGSAYPGYGQGSILSVSGGHVLMVTGDAFDSSSVQHWITRRLVVP